MTRFHLLLALAGVTGAAVALAPTAPASATPTLPAAVVAQAAATVVPDTEQPNVGWLARYGVYNAHQGSWSFIPAANSGDGC
jgi:hypothetical protein